MNSLFRYDAARVDARLVEWAQNHSPSPVETIEQAEQRAPGFTASGLADVGYPEAHDSVKQQLWNLTYWLFVGGVIVHPTAGAEHKSVLTANVRNPPVPAIGVAHLAVWASVGMGDGPAVLVPFPQVADGLVNPNSGASFRQSREALHEAAIVCVDRVNLVWPVALALAVGAAR